MATVLYLNDTQVYPDSSQSIKLTRENPYFTEAESYTLDVVLPMEILENRSFFGNLQRMERSKQVQPMTCRLLVDNHPELVGTARVTQVTDREVKVQLLGGRSEVNFLSNDNNDYIDELDLGRLQISSQGANPYTTTTGIGVKLSEVYDETLEYISSNTPQFCLLDIMRELLSHYGFVLGESSINILPWNRLYVATAKLTWEVSHVLPHWHPREFITEFCRFFNVTLLVDQVGKTVRFESNRTFFTQGNVVTLSPVDEYTADLAEENNGNALATDNLEFDMSGSDQHDYDVLPDKVRELAPTESYNSKAEAESAYNALGEEERLKRIFSTPTGKYAGWKHDYSDAGGSEENVLFTAMDMFAPLVRQETGASVTKLKICPVAMGDMEFEVGTIGERVTTERAIVPSVENPTGNEMKLRYYHNGIFSGGRRGGTNDSNEYQATIQEYVTGESDIEKEEKEDRLQVMFIDDINQPVRTKTGSGENFTTTETSASIGFTDWKYKQSHGGQSHSPWSLSLNPTDATFYLGQLHQNGFSFNTKAKQVFKFIADSMPDATRIYIIRNKRYGCEKIEANVTADGFDRLMTGYFYEML